MIEYSLDQLNVIKANVDSPSLTGTPTAPTAPSGTSTTQLATTAFVTAADNSLQSQINGKQNALGFTPVQQGTGIGQGNSTIKIGWSGSKVKCTVDGTDMGGIWTDVNGSLNAAANGFQKLPTGLIIQWGSLSQTAQSTSFNFPIAFPNQCFVVTTTVQGNASPSESGVTNITLSGAASFRDSSVDNLWVSYIAIGN